MNWIDKAIDAAQSLNPKVQVEDRGDWLGLGRLVNVTVPGGEMTSIVLRPGDDNVRKITETVGRFQRP